MPLENLETTKEHWSVNDEALDIDNEDAELWFNRGEVLKELKRYDDSLDSFNKALNARTRLWISLKMKKELTQIREVI